MKKEHVKSVRLGESLQVGACLITSMLLVNYFVKLGSFMPEAVVFLALYAVLKTASSALISIPKNQNH